MRLILEWRERENRQANKDMRISAKYYVDNKTVIWVERGKVLI